MSGLPEDPRLAAVARALEQTRSAAALCDRHWNLVWVSAEMKAVLGEHDEERLGYGKHVLEAYLGDTWCTKITPETQARMFVEYFPMLIKDTPGGKRRLEAMLRDAIVRWTGAGNDDWAEAAHQAEVIEGFEHMEPVDPPLVWSFRMEFVQKEDIPPLDVVEVGVRLRDDDGLVGTAVVYSSALPARVMSFVARGDEGMFERMARLVDPEPRRAAILFADLQESASLSRRVPSATYFRLVRALTTAIDEVVIRHRGIVGKHAGDGATAFFLVDDLGSPSAACAAAIAAARDITVAARNAAKEVGEETGLVDPDECLVNVAVHWGGTLFMGQLVTGGRLEVTALGDEVNECARIQQSARDGEILASKVVIEHVDAEDAEKLGFESARMLYRTVAELPGAPDKAKRDAGNIPVTSL